MSLLPLEIIDLILSYLDYDDLTRLFHLDEPDLGGGPDDLLGLRHMALCQCYNHKRVAITNEYTADVLLTPRRLDYLAANNLVISPKSLSIVLSTSFQLRWIPYLKSIDNIHMYVENKQVLGMFKTVMATLRFTSLTVHSKLPVTLPITIQNLLDNLFSPKDILECPIGLENLTHLDLSYNNLLDLSHITLPTLLTTLNLSNNNLWRIDNLQSLTKLSTLDLSNNHLVYININIPSLIRINLLGNNLDNINFLLNSFNNLLYLDLSRNLISHLSKFPPNLISINLAWNYLNTRFDSNVFPKNLQELDVSWCKLSQEIVLPGNTILKGAA
jgi:Leucine-rich repeat (LRR) protein